MWFLILYNKDQMYCKAAYEATLLLYAFCIQKRGAA